MFLSAAAEAKSWDVMLDVRKLNFTGAIPRRQNRASSSSSSLLRRNRCWIDFQLTHDDMFIISESAATRCLQSVCDLIVVRPLSFFPSTLLSRHSCYHHQHHHATHQVRVSWATFVPFPFLPLRMFVLHQYLYLAQSAVSSDLPLHVSSYKLLIQPEDELFSAVAVALIAGNSRKEIDFFSVVPPNTRRSNLSSFNA